jgi:hypothetical protein
MIRLWIAWIRLGMNGNANGMVLCTLVARQVDILPVNVVLIFVLFLTFQDLHAVSPCMPLLKRMLTVVQKKKLTETSDIYKSHFRYRRGTRFH